jgi:hypothetical protein
MFKAGKWKVFSRSIPLAIYAKAGQKGKSEALLFHTLFGVVVISFLGGVISGGNFRTFADSEKFLQFTSEIFLR